VPLTEIVFFKVLYS